MITYDITFYYSYLHSVSIASSNRKLLRQCNYSFSAREHTNRWFFSDPKRYFCIRTLNTGGYLMMCYQSESEKSRPLGSFSKLSNTKVTQINDATTKNRDGVRIDNVKQNIEFDFDHKIVEQTSVTLYDIEPIPVAQLVNELKQRFDSSNTKKQVRIAGVKSTHYIPPTILPPPVARARLLGFDGTK